MLHTRSWLNLLDLPDALFFFLTHNLSLICFTYVIIDLYFTSLTFKYFLPSALLSCISLLSWHSFYFIGAHLSYLPLALCYLPINLFIYLALVCLTYLSVFLLTWHLIYLLVTLFTWHTFGLLTWTFIWRTYLAHTWLTWHSFGLLIWHSLIAHFIYLALTFPTYHSLAIPACRSLHLPGTHLPYLLGFRLAYLPSTHFSCLGHIHLALTFLPTWFTKRSLSLIGTQLAYPSGTHLAYLPGTHLAYLPGTHLAYLPGTYLAY